jgi:hypothetical protein
MRDLSLDSTLLYVQGKTQTFLDNVIIEMSQDVTRRWHRPERRIEQPVIQRDRPWEHTLYFTYSNHCVLYDPQDGLIKCWYEDMEGPPKATGGHFGFFSRQLYAYSRDGLNWTKPELDVCSVDGQRTNIVLGSREYGQVHSAAYVIDEHPSTPDERFRAIYTYIDDQPGRSIHRTECAHSADGIHWQTYDTPPTFGTCDARLGDVSILYYDPDAREFVQNTRHCRMGRGPLNPRHPRNPSFNSPHEPHRFDSYGQRRIFQCRSHDFVHWTEPMLVAAADDFEDNLDESFYGMAQFKVGGLYLGTVGVLRQVDNEMDVQLLMSRDGLRWQRTGKRQPFLAPRGEGSWDAHMVSLTSPPIPMGDELWFFHGGTNVHHDWWLTGVREGLQHPDALYPEKANFGLGLAVLRRDGFAGLYANELREGIVITRALASNGNRLIINGRCGPDGSIRAEIVDTHDQVLGDCSKQRCDAFAGDSVAHEVTWAGRAAFRPQGDSQLVRVRFYLRDAELFSFRLARSGDDGC